MEPFSALAGAILTALGTDAAKRAGAGALGKLSRKASARAKLATYLQRLTNLNSYFVTYRIARQHIKDAYVEPRIINSAVTRTHLLPEQFKAAIGASNFSPDDGRFKRDAPSRESVKGFSTVELSYITVAELLASSADCIVLGDAGDGKSSLLAYLCWKRLHSVNPRIPVFIDSRQLRNASLRDCLRDCLAEAGIEYDSLTTVSCALSIYVDGLDELTRDKYNEICLEINTLNAEAPSIQFTVSCRSGAYKGNFEQMREVSVAPFTREHIDMFVTRWYVDVHDGPDANELLGQIHSSDRLMELATKPLLLALMCSAFRRYLNIARRPTALFKQCIDSLIWEWDAKRLVRREGAFAGLDLEKQVWLHSLLAVKLHDAGRRYCDQNLPRSVLAESLPKFGVAEHNAPTVLAEMVGSHCIFVKWTEETYGFSHLSLQEFLAAVWYRSDRRWEVLLSPDRIQNPWWQYVIAFCFASMDDATEALGRLYKAEGVDDIRRLKLVAHCLRYDPVVDESLRNEAIRTILHWYHNLDWQHHEAAVEMLVGMEDDWTAPVIRRSLAGTLTPSEINSILVRRSTAQKAEKE